MDEDEGMDFPIEDEIEVIYSDGDEEDEEFLTPAGEETFDQNIEEDVNIVDNARVTFTGHNSSVFSCDLTSDKSLAVSGGEDDIAYVWTPDTASVVFECTGHKDSVTEVKFSRDNQWLATGDMGGMIQVWSVKERKLTWCFEGDDLEWLEWHPLANVLISGSHSGTIYIWQIPQGNCKTLPSHGQSTCAGRVLPNGKQLLAGYEDGSLKMWDMKSTTTLWQIHETSGSDTAVTSIEVNSEGTLAIISPSAKLIRLTDGKIVNTLLCGDGKEIEVALFSSELNVIVTGSLLGQLCVWELGKYALRHQAKVESAVAILKLGPDGILYVGAVDGVICVCDVRSGTLIKRLTGHCADILGLCVSSDGKMLISTSDDHTAKVFDVGV